MTMGFLKSLKRVLSGGWMPKEKRPPNIVLISSRAINEDEFIFPRNEFQSVDPVAATRAENKVIHPTQEPSVDGDAAASMNNFQSENANINLERNNLINQVMNLQEDLSRSREDFVLLASLYLTSKETFELETHVHEEDKTDLNVHLRDCRLRVAQLELKLVALLEAQQTRSVSSFTATKNVETQTEVSDEDTTTTATVFTKIQPADPVNNLQAQDNLIYDLSNVPVGLRSKVAPIQIRNALTDGRYEERKEDMMNQIWLQNRLLQVETERDWIIEEKVSLEKMVAAKAEMAMRYISELFREKEAMSSYLESETDRADRAEKHAEEETTLRTQDREQFRRLRVDHEEIAYELKSTQIALEESQSIITDLEQKIELLRLTTIPQPASVLDIDDQPMAYFNQGTLPEPKTAAPVFTCSDIRYKGRPIEGYTAIPNSHDAPHQYDTGAEVHDNVLSTVIFDYLIPSSISSPEERVEASPPESFLIRDEVVKSDLGLDTVTLTNIAGLHYGRIVGKGGSNVLKLKAKYNVNVVVSGTKNPQDRITVVISFGSANNRHSAAKEIMENLPVEVEVYFKMSLDVKKRGRKSCPFVKIQDIGQGKFLLSGKLQECRKVFEDLKSSN